MTDSLVLVVRKADDAGRTECGVLRQSKPSRPTFSRPNHAVVLFYRLNISYIRECCLNPGKRILETKGEGGRG